MVSGHAAVPEYFSLEFILKVPSNLYTKGTVLLALLSVEALQFYHNHLTIWENSSLNHQSINKNGEKGQ